MTERTTKIFREPLCTSAFVCRPWFQWQAVCLCVCSQRPWDKRVFFFFLFWAALTKFSFPFSPESKAEALRIGGRKLSCHRSLVLRCSVEVSLSLWDKWSLQIWQVRALILCICVLPSQKSWCLQWWSWEAGDLLMAAVLVPPLSSDRSLHSLASGAPG